LWELWKRTWEIIQKTWEKKEKKSHVFSQTLEKIGLRVKVVKAKNAKLQGMRARVTREDIGAPQKNPMIYPVHPARFFPLSFLSKNYRKVFKKSTKI
jgi:hypothetical protein